MSLLTVDGLPLVLNDNGRHFKRRKQSSLLKKTAEFHFYGHENMKFYKRRSRTKKEESKVKEKIHNTKYCLLFDAKWTVFVSDVVCCT